MKLIAKFLVLIFILIALPVYSATQNEVKQAIIKQSQELGVDPAIMLSIAKNESGFRQEARGGNNVGVFQLLPATAKRMGLNAYNLDDNIKGGILYYKSMYNMFGSMELAVAAYNTGAGAIKRNGNKVPSYTQGFVNRIMKDYRYYSNAKN